METGWKHALKRGYTYCANYGMKGKLLREDLVDFFKLNMVSN